MLAARHGPRPDVDRARFGPCGQPLARSDAPLRIKAADGQITVR